MKPDKFLEALGIAQEEAAEVIQSLSKIRRSGLDYKPFDGEKTNRDIAQDEIYDFIMLVEYCGFDVNPPEDFRTAKFEKLRRWSTLMDNDDETR